MTVLAAPTFLSAKLPEVLATVTWSAPSTPLNVAATDAPVVASYTFPLAVTLAASMAGVMVACTVDAGSTML